MHSIMRLASRLGLTALLGLAATTSNATVTEYVHTDALGSIVAITDTNRAVLERREYEPFGEQLTPAAQNGPGYTGHVQDAATGLTYMQQRYYDAGVGRFLSVDPVTVLDAEDVRHLNRYGYAYNSPYRFADPDGRWAEDLIVGIPSIALGAASLYDNISEGNFGWAAVDAAGIIVDAVAVAVPGIPGGAGVGIKATRLADNLSDADNVRVIGRQTDTAVAKEWNGHEVLDTPDWTLEKNDEWIQEGIDRGQSFYTASPTEGNLWDDVAGRETVYAREIRQIENAGYEKRGDYYVRPEVE